MTLEGKPIQVLYIEDDRAIARLLQRRLALDGINVDIAEDAYAGLDMFSDNEYDLVVIDYDLPGTNGLDLLRKWHYQRIETPTIIISGHGSIQVAVEAMKLGASDFIVKRANSQYVSELPRTIKRVVAEYRETIRHQQTEAEKAVALRKRNDHLFELNRVSQDLASTLDSQKVMTQMLIAATSIVGATEASIWVWENSQKQHLVCRATSNLAMLATLQQFKLAPGDDSIVGWVAANVKSTIVADTNSDERFSMGPDSETGYSTESLIAVPLVFRGDVYGVLEILNKENAPFDDEDLSLASTLATSAAIAMENAQLVEKLRSQRTELQARNEELDAFAHTVAHDLKTPLIWISGYADLLIQDNEKIDRETSLLYAESIMDGAGKMEQIIDELLLLASLRDASIIIDAVDMQRVVSEAQGRLRYQINEANATIQVAEKFPPIEGYGPWLEGVWVNYISNALKYGGEPPVIEIGCTDDPNDEYVWFWVQDNGDGIAASKQDQLFMPFSRLDNVASKSGHGVGLSIVQHIVEKLGGKVGVESVEGQGSRFMFALLRPDSVAEVDEIGDSAETTPSLKTQ